MLAGGAEGLTLHLGGLLADLSGDSTRALFTGNMGPDAPLTILNGIGDRATIGLSNPSSAIKEVLAGPPTNLGRECPSASEYGAESRMGMRSLTIHA